MTETSAYPDEHDGYVVLPNSRLLRIRPLQRSDENLVRELYDHLSPRTRYLRFLSQMPTLPDYMVRMLVYVDDRRQLGLVAEHDSGNGKEKEIVGLASFGAIDDRSVEVALVIRDDWQRQCLGTELAGRLLQAAEARGFHRFVANVSSDNVGIRRILRNLGDVVSTKMSGGVSELVFVRSRTKSSKSYTRSEISRCKSNCRIEVCEMKILAVCGSLQAKSGNLALLNVAAASTPPGVELVRFNGLRDLPHFNPDIEASGVPESVSQWRLAVTGSDAVLIASPEYCFSLPGVLKNGIDWLIGSGELEQKVVAITAAVAGPERGRRGLEALRDTLSAVRATIVGGEPIPKGPGFESQVAALVRALVEAAAAHRE